MTAVPPVDRSAAGTDCRNRVAVGRVVRKEQVSRIVGRLAAVGDVAGFVARMIVVVGILVLAEDLVEDSFAVEVLVVARHKEAAVGTSGATIVAVVSEIAVDIEVVPLRTLRVLRSLDVP